MFKKYTIIIWSLFVLTLFVLLFLLLDVRSTDMKKYQDLVESSKEQDEDMLAYSGKQQRSDVTKDIWYVNGNSDTRLHLRIRCDKSQLVFVNTDNKNAIIEYMNNINCYIQEELFYIMPNGEEAVLNKGTYRLRSNDEVINVLSEDLVPMQQIRYIKAKTATHNYTNNMFFADEVELLRYIVPGHQINENLDEIVPLMQGTARSVTFSLEGNDVNFQSKHLQAVFYSPKRGLL